MHHCPPAVQPCHMVSSLQCCAGKIEDKGIREYSCCLSEICVSPSSHISYCPSLLSLCVLITRKSTRQNASSGRGHGTMSSAQFDWLQTFNTAASIASSAVPKMQVLLEGVFSTSHASIITCKKNPTWSAGAGIGMSPTQCMLGRQLSLQTSTDVALLSASAWTSY